MFDESSQCTIVLPEECLGYALVVMFPAYGFAALVSHNEIHSLNRIRQYGFITFLIIYIPKISQLSNETS